MHDQMEREENSRDAKKYKKKGGDKKLTWKRKLKGMLKR